MGAQNKKPTADQVRASLNVGNPPSASQTASPTATDSGTNGGASLAAGESLIRLHIKSVRQYKHNPRTKPNPLYVEIRESIRARGLDNIFKVTKRPGEDYYFPARGGNTRLLALDELFDETGDSKFEYVDFVYTEFTSESDIRAGHIVENTKRADLVFWDNAKSLRDLKHDYEAELGVTLSGRRYAELLKERGVDVSREVLRICIFATDKLSELGSAAMLLSRNNVTDQILPMYQKLSKFAAKFDISDDQFSSEISTPVLQDIARRFEAGNVFSTDALCEQLLDATAIACGYDTKSIRVMLTMLEQNPTLTKEELTAPPPLVDNSLAPNIDVAPKLQHQEPNSTVASGHSGVHNGSDLNDGGDATGDEMPHPSDVNQGGTASNTRAKTTDILYASNLTPGDNTRKPHIEPTAPLDFGTGSGSTDSTSTDQVHGIAAAIDPMLQFLSTLQAFVQVTNLVDALRIDEAMPLGFYVDLPEPEEAGIPLDIESQAGGNPYRYQAWWFLANLCGIVDEKSAARSSLPVDAAIAKALGDDELWDDEIRNTIGDPLYDGTLGQLITWMADPSNRAGEMLLRLITVLRTIHVTAPFHADMTAEQVSS